MRHHKHLSHLSRRSRLTSTAVAAATVAAALPLALAPGAYADAPGEPATPDLTVSELSGNQLRPGEVRSDSVTLTNNGTVATDGVTFRLRLTRGLAFTAPVDGCTYSTVGDKVRQAVCELDVGIAPGESYTVPVKFRVLKKALMEVVEYGTSRTGEDPGRATTRPTAGSRWTPPARPISSLRGTRPRGSPAPGSSSRPRSATTDRAGSRTTRATTTRRSS